MVNAKVCKHNNCLETINTKQMLQVTIYKFKLLSLVFIYLFFFIMHQQQAAPPNQQAKKWCAVKVKTQRNHRK